MFHKVWYILGIGLLTFFAVLRLVLKVNILLPYTLMAGVVLYAFHSKPLFPHKINFTVSEPFHTISGSLLMKKIAEQAGYYSGTSGLVLPYKNKTFYPAEFQSQSRLTFYGSLFNSIEINSSFYKIPRAITVRKWADSVPENFRFTFKLWKGITHNKDLLFDPKDVNTFMTAISAVEQRRGCLLVQFPASIKYSAFKQLHKLIDSIQSHHPDHGWNISLEFRDKSWYREETFKMMEEKQCGLVIHDKTGSQAPMEDLNSPFIYLRFHGPGGDYRGSYDDAFLAEYATYIQEWLSDMKQVYVYFNNTMGDAVKNLSTLNKYVRL